MLDRAMDEPTLYKYRHVSALFIQHAVWLHVRFTLSLRDVEDLPSIGALRDYLAGAARFDPLIAVWPRQSPPKAR
jgi:hypothetical protein